MNAKITTTLLLLLLGLTMWGQKKWSLTECVDHALTHNLQLKELDYLKMSEAEEAKQSIRAMLPSLEGFSNYSVSYGRSVDPNTNEIVSSDFFSNNYSIDAGLDIFQGFQKWHRLKASRLNEEAATQDREQEEFLLSFRVMKAYYDVLYFDKAIDIAKEQTAVSEQNIRSVEKQIELGLKAGTDRHLAEALLTGDELQQSRLENEAKRARIELAQEMNLETSEDGLILLEDYQVEVSKPSKDYDLKELYAQASGWLPLMKSQQSRLSSAELTLKQSRAQLSPSLEAFVGYGTGFYETNRDVADVLIPFNDQIRDNASQYIGASLTIPISNSGVRRNRLDQQKIEVLRALNQQDLRAQELRKTLQSLLADHEAAALEYHMSMENEESLRLTFEIAQKKYEKGLFSAMDLYRAKNLYAVAQNDRLQLEMRTHLLQKTLDCYAGQPVFGDDTSMN